MSNVFTDSFSNYSTLTQLNAKWSGGSANASVGGSFAIGAASQGMQLNAGNATVNIPSYGHYFFGIRQKWVSGPSGQYFVIRDQANVIYEVDFDATGHVLIKVNSALQNTSTLTIAVGQTHYYEIELQLGASGIFKVWVDGVLFCTFTGTLGTTPFTMASFQCLSGGGGGTVVNLGDCYINNDLGTTCNSRQGDTTVNSYRVTTPGTYAQFNRGGTDTGTNAGQLNKALADATSFNVSNIVNNRDSFKMAAVPAPSVALLGARLWINLQKDSFGPRQLALTQISGAADNTGASQIVSGPGYTWLSEDQSIDKNTGALWVSVTPLNLAEFGYKITV